MRKLFLLFLLLLMPALSACAVNTHLGERDLQRIAGKTYVVTGASGGFGRGVAEMLGRERANVVLAARRANVLEDVAAVIRASSGQALVMPTDVSDPAQIERLARESVARFGRIGVWINNAGVGTIGRFEDIPIADHSRAVDTPFWQHAANYSGRKGRMAAMDPPEKVVQAIVWASLHPREEVPLGWKARAVSTFHTVTPDLVEAVSGNIVHAEQKRKASPQAPGPGSLHAPMAEGTTVEGGVRARMKAEDAAREAEPK